MTKKIIDGKLYNTETAREVAYNTHDYKSSFSYFEETLYCKKTGEYFLYGYGHAASRYAKSAGQNTWGPGEELIPLSYENARKWMEDNATVEQYEAEFGEVQDDDSTVQLTVSMSASDAEKLRRGARENGLPIGRFIATLLQK